jgi:hypothetical protein
LYTDTGDEGPINLAAISTSPFLSDSICTNVQ